MWNLLDRSIYVKLGLKAQWYDQICFNSSIREKTRDPHVICIEKMWRDESGEASLHGNFYYRPQETYHVATKKFLEKVCIFYSLYHIILRLITGKPVTKLRLITRKTALSLGYGSKNIYSFLNSVLDSFLFYLIKIKIDIMGKERVNLLLHFGLKELGNV